MKGKFTTKTIIIAIAAIILFAVAITGTVIFLKDSGEASATEGNQNIIGSEQSATENIINSVGDNNNIENIDGANNENSAGNNNENGNNENGITANENNNNNIAR